MFQRSETCSFDRFSFIDPGPLVDGDLELALERCVPGVADRPVTPRSPQYHFGMMARRDGGVLRRAGGIRFRAITTAMLEHQDGHIGYDVDPEFRGRRFATRATRLLFPLARAHGFVALLITANPDNFASRRSIESVGGRLLEIVQTLPGTDAHTEGEFEKCRYRVELG